jgi:hypothetical protein
MFSLAPMRLPTMIPPTVMDPRRRPQSYQGPRSLPMFQRVIPRRTNLLRPGLGKPRTCVRAPSGTPIELPTSPMLAKASQGVGSGSGAVWRTSSGTDGIIKAPGSRNCNFSGGNFHPNTGKVCVRDVR